MDLRQLNHFIAVAEERHFGRAAERLHMAQPPLSQQIRQLEEELGVRLLDRTTRRVDLTPAGQELLDRGRRIVTELETLTADVHRVGNGAAGVLRVGFSGPATYGVMPRLGRAVQEQLPGVSLVLHGEMPGPAMEAGLREHTLDAAILSPPVASQDIEHRLVHREELVVAVPRDSSLAAGPVSARLLQDQQFVSHPPESVIARTVSELCRASGFRMRIGQVTHETAGMLSLVAAGGGVAVLPESVRALRLSGVVYVDLQDSPGVDVAVAWRRNDRSALLRSFLHLVLDVMEGP
ncbi:LysR family transcriptional regulator [Kocuria tytonis]|uniref:LysR family transcriptional regulator n=1 Tax=Kocuria tytonis TaxID=2054280 RepID=A0A495A6N8_9MICC|nr:LysR substrate-binding domain-containing protein [Kocuria tytonis]RKQ35400.1 LysR family transcriptional regulator [Kocuria tytonis]